MKRTGALLALMALAGCAAVSGTMNAVTPFDRFDGRWVADLGPHPGTCCPTRLVLDVDGHRINGEAADCSGTRGLIGKVDKTGAAALKAGRMRGVVHFDGENFSAELPDTCPVPINGSRGG